MEFNALEFTSYLNNNTVFIDDFNNLSSFYMDIHKLKTRLNIFELFKKTELWPNKLIIFVYLVIFIVGLVSNVIVIFFIFLNKRMQTMTNKFIINLAVADLLVLLVCIPVTISRFISEEWILGEFMCIFSNYTQGLFYFLAIYILQIFHY